MAKNEELKECIELCWACRTECMETLFGHCLEMGGEHTESDHVKIMVDCIEICQLAADSMVRQSPLHARICAACASICDACADSCDDIGDDGMDECAEICRQCAEACRDMIVGQRKAA